MNQLCVGTATDEGIPEGKQSSEKKKRRKIEEKNSTSKSTKPNLVKASGNLKYPRHSESHEIRVDWINLHIKREREEEKEKVVGRRRRARGRV